MAILQNNKSSGGRQHIAAALDIGTTKITCMIARITDNGHDPQPEIRVLGVREFASRGIRAGVVMDMEAAEYAISGAVDQAERMAGEMIHRVWVNVSSPNVKSRILREELALYSGEVDPRDINKVLGNARARAFGSMRETLHAIPVGYSVDHSRGIRDPEGMRGEVLGLNMHEVTCDPGPLHNISLCVERCHLEPEGTVFSAYASALAAAVDDEMEMGVTVLELGGGTTSIASFHDGRMIFAKTLPIGGHHVTVDLADGLSTPLMKAERIKILYGSTFASPNDDREMIDVPLIGEENATVANHVPRSMLVSIIKPRIEETLELARDALNEAGLMRAAGHRIVLTGGASQLNGLRELTKHYFDAHVRLGTPRGLIGLPENYDNPAFTTAAGLLTYIYRAPREAPRPTGAGAGFSGFLNAIGLGRKGKVVAR